jgi:large subunit ribosomal protein L10
LKEAGFDQEVFMDSIKGTNAILFVRKDADPMPVLRAFAKFAKEQPFVVPKATLFEGQVFEGNAVIELSKLPSRDELYAMLCNRLQAPISKFVYSLNGILSKLVYALEAIKAEKEKQV